MEITIQDADIEFIHEGNKVVIFDKTKFTEDEQNMALTFEQAWRAMICGCKVKRKEWKGYWDLKDDMIYIHCEDGEVLKLIDTKDLPFTINNMMQNDWELVSNTANIEDILNDTFDISEAIRRFKLGSEIGNKDFPTFGLKYNKKSNLCKVSGLQDLIKILMKEPSKFIESTAFYEIK